MHSNGDICEGDYKDDRMNEKAKFKVPKKKYFLWKSTFTLPLYKMGVRVDFN